MQARFIPHKGNILENILENESDMENIVLIECYRGFLYLKKNVCLIKP